MSKKTGFIVAESIVLEGSADGWRFKFLQDGQFPPSFLEEVKWQEFAVKVGLPYLDFKPDKPRGDV